MNATLQKPEFEKLSTWIYTNLGVKMPPVKITLLETRLQKRLRHLRLKSFRDYLQYLFSEEGQQHELPFMIDLVTTHKTDFFREDEHFDYLAEHAIPDMIEKFGVKNGVPFKFWSAACSSGEEVYTLAMVLEEFRKRRPSLPFTYRVLGTDISEGVLATARTAVYDETRMQGISLPFRKKYFLRGKDQENPRYRVIPEIRRRTNYAVLNLMDERYPIRDLMDVIFCRNVLIYFDKNTQERVLQRCCENLKSGGYLFISHTETVVHFQLPVQKVSASVFQKI